MCVRARVCVCVRVCVWRRQQVRTSLDEISPALSELDVHAKLMKTVVDDAAGLPWMSEMVTPAKSTLLRQIALIKEEVTAYRGEVADKLQATSDAVKSSLTSRRGCIEMASNATIEANAMVKQFLGGEFKSVVDTLKEVFGPIRFYTYPGASAALGAVVLPFLMAMVGERVEKRQRQNLWTSMTGRDW